MELSKQKDFSSDRGWQTVHGPQCRFASAGANVKHHRVIGVSCGAGSGAFIIQVGGATSGNSVGGLTSVSVFSLELSVWAPLHALGTPPPLSRGSGERLSCSNGFQEDQSRRLQCGGEGGGVRRQG